MWLDSSFISIIHLLLNYEVCFCDLLQHHGILMSPGLTICVYTLKK